jgi:hypothetical protein
MPLMRPPSAEPDWRYYSLEKSTASDGALATDLGSEKGDDITGNKQGCSNALEPIDEERDTTATPSSLVTKNVSPQPTVAPLATAAGVETVSNRPSSDLPNNSHSASPTEASTLKVAPMRDQGIPDPKVPDLPGHLVPPSQPHAHATLDGVAMTQESQWMRSKKTLAYFYGTHKMGKLLDVILHWYQLEETLGFCETVSSLANHAEALY